MDFSDLNPNNNLTKEKLEYGYIKESRIVREEAIHLNKKHRKPYKNMNKLQTTNTNKTKAPKQMEKKAIDKSTDIKPKLKNQLQMMYNNLSKIMKKEGFFIEANKSYENIHVYKDYNVSIVGLHSKKHQLSVRAEIGIWKD